MLRFLYGNRNIAGSVLGLVGLGLFFAGITEHYWLVIVAGLYSVGFVGAPGSKKVDLSIGKELSVEAVSARLKELVIVVRRKAEPDVLPPVTSIADSISTILPRLVPGEGPIDQTTLTVRQTALDYLPTTLSTYLGLPPAYRRLHVVRDGKTAHDLLLDQLHLLDGKMKEIVANMHTNDAQALLANGRFLEEKFGVKTSNFQLA
jgi:hypothetical protein